MRKIIKFTEPTRSQNLSIKANNLLLNSQFLQQILPITADIFVFFYPIFLIILYLKGEFSKQKKYQIYALNLFFSAALAVVINYIIKFFVEKIRPDQFLNLNFAREKLIFHDIPNSTFPSDHMAVGMAITRMVLLISKKENTKIRKILFTINLIFVLIMMYSRFAIGIHWITDLIAGFFVGIVSAQLINLTKIQNFLKNKIYNFLLKISDTIFENFLKIKK